MGVPRTEDELVSLLKQSRQSNTAKRVGEAPLPGLERSTVQTINGRTLPTVIDLEFVRIP